VNAHTAKRDAPMLSRRLAAWARRAGYLLSEDGEAALLSSLDGELRYYVRSHDDGWLTLTFASRSGRERLVVRATSADVLERILTRAFGDTIRLHAGFDVLALPFDREQLALGYTLSDMSGDGFRTLYQGASRPIAMARDATRSMMYLVPLSHEMQYTVDELQSAFLDPRGEPLWAGTAYGDRRDQA
jgi:hypothetical protein